MKENIQKEEENKLLKNNKNYKRINNAYLLLFAGSLMSGILLGSILIVLFSVLTQDKFLDEKTKQKILKRRFNYVKKIKKYCNNNI